MTDKKRALRNMAITIAVILAAFGIFAAGFYGYKSYADREASKMIIVYLNADGTFSYLTPSNVVPLDELKIILKENVSAAGSENGGASKFTLYIRTDPGAHGWQLLDLFVICYDNKIRKLSLSERNTDEWFENANLFGIEYMAGFSAFNDDLTKNHKSTMGWNYDPPEFMHSFYEVRIKLLWYSWEDKANMRIRRQGESINGFLADVKDGRTIYKISDHIFHNENRELQITDFVNYLKTEKVNYKKTKDPFKRINRGVLPIIIDFREPVEIKHVLHVLRILKSLSLDNITFAAREIPY
jgi:hypothetical protein